MMKLRKLPLILKLPALAYFSFLAWSAYSVFSGESDPVERARWVNVLWTGASLPLFLMLLVETCLRVHDSAKSPRNVRYLNLQ